MSITSILRNFNGDPNSVYILTDDNLQTITTPGYLLLPTIAQDIQALQNGDFQWTPTDVVWIHYEPDSIGIFQMDPIANSFVSVLSQGVQTYLPTISYDNPGNLTVSYASQIGSYSINGGVCHVDIQLVFTPTFTTASGNFQVILPIPSAANSGGTIWGTTATVGIGFPAGRTFLSPIAAQGTNHAVIIAMGSAVADQNLTTATFLSGVAHTVNLTLNYPVDV